MPPASPWMLYRSVWSIPPPADEGEFKDRRNAWHAARSADASADAARRRKLFEEVLAREAQRLRGSMAQYLVTPLRSDIAEVEKMIAEYAGRILDLSGGAPLRSGEGEMRGPSAGARAFVGWDTSLKPAGRHFESLVMAGPGWSMLRCLEEPAAPPGATVIEQEIFVLHAGDPGHVCIGPEMVCRCSLAPGTRDSFAQLAASGAWNIWRKVPAGGPAEEWMLRMPSQVEQPELASQVLLAAQPIAAGRTPRLTFIQNVISVS